MTIDEHPEWTDRLSEYLDGELSRREQRAMEAHLAGCAECARVLDELRAVVEGARALTPTAPPADLWRGVADRITSAEGSRPSAGDYGRRRRFSFTWPELVAASILLILVSGWAALRLTNRPEPGTAGTRRSPEALAGTVRPNGTASAVFDSRPAVVAADFDDTEYDAAVADLQRTLQNGRGQLDPATVRVVEQNLAVIDQAVEEARRALAQDPANADLNRYVLDTRRRKLDLLRQATALAEDFN